MKKLFIVSTVILFSLSVSCTKTDIIGGHIILDNMTKDTLPGVTIGIYQKKDSLEGTGTDWTWKNLKLLQESTSDENGYFEFEVDHNILAGELFILMAQPTDTLTENSKYCNTGLRRIDYGKRSEVILTYGINNWIKLENFETSILSVNANGKFVETHILPGKAYDIAIYKNPETHIASHEKILVGKTTLYVPKILPQKSDKVIWERPKYEIVIDNFALEK
jgi:hypothetical protein